MTWQLSPGARFGSFHSLSVHSRLTAIAALDQR
jgi:hypothetical protein